MGTITVNLAVIVSKGYRLLSSWYI